MTGSRLPREGLDPRSERRAPRWHRFGRAAAAAVVGAGAAAAYAHFFGCATGTCPLTSSVWTAASYGAVVGAIAGWPSHAP